MFNIVTNSDVDYTPLVYKDLSVAKDIEGEYKFSCKYPELYEVGIGRKKNNLGLKGEKYDWTNNPPIKLQVEIISNKGEVVFSKKVVDNFLGGRLTSKGLENTIARMELSRCKDYTLRIELISGDFLEYGGKGLLYLYLAVSGYI